MGRQYSQQYRRGPIQYLRDTFSRITGRNRDTTISGFTDPEVTVTREECDTISELSSTVERNKTSVCGPKCHSCECWFEPNSSASYWWSFIVGCAVLYNYWIIVYRYAFDEINSDTMLKWFILDYTMDLIYLLDILKGFRTAYLDEGVLQTSTVKMRVHYMNSMLFYIDCLCLLPLDCLYLSINFNSLLRCFRLIKVYKLLKFLDITERHTNYPNLVRTLTMLHYLLMIFHWNASIFYKVMGNSSAFYNENFNKDAPGGK